MSFHIMCAYTDKVSGKFFGKTYKQIQLYLRARKLMEIFIWKISRIRNGFQNKYILICTLRGLQLLFFMCTCNKKVAFVLLSHNILYV